MPKKDFGRCDGHHEMDDFHAQKNAPLRAWAGLSFKRKPRACTSTFPSAPREAYNDAHDVTQNKQSTGIAGCCARAASGHATAAPPSNVMKSRRFI
jgi:hypothetical protein